MLKRGSKKLNSKQKTIALIALIVTVFLAICITFAWYTNRINVMNGKFSLGSFAYDVTLFDVEGTTATQLNTKHYSQEDEDAWSLSSHEINMGSDSVKYQIIKVKNNSGFDIKAYEYLTYNQMSAEQTALSNYFYFKPYVLNISGDVGETAISNYLSTYTFPSASDIASPNGEVTFGTIKNNAVALEKGTVENAEVSYYLIAYCVTGLPNEMLTGSYQDKTVDVNPIVTIGQANGPVPQTTSSAKVLYADSWQALRSAIASANSGDTIYLTRNIESPVGTNLSMTNGVNLNLNSYNLIIHGDLVFNYKVTEERRLTVPVSSRLYVDGDMYITNLGPFSINSTNSAQNVFIGKVEEGVVTGGNIYANCGLSVTDTTDSISGTVDDETYLEYIVADENSGLILNNIRLRKADAASDNVAADITVTGSDTMVKVGAGSVLNSIVLPTGKAISDVYVVNYGEVDSIDLSNMEYNGKSYKVSAYVKNFNTVNSLSLKTGASGAKGIETAGREVFNTRVINGDGAVTTFSGNYNSNYFEEIDIEPFNQTTDESYVVENDRLTGVYTVYLKNVAANSGANAESITSLFTAQGFNPANCSRLRIVTNNSIKLKQAQFENIRDYFSSLQALDLSSAAVANAEIPANALNATLASAAVTNLEEVTLPFTSVGIGDNAFKGTKIKEITIGSNVTSIGTDAFNVDDSVSLEVIWDGADSIPNTFLTGFDVNKTIIFMEESLAQLSMSLGYSDAWKLNMYEFYDFKADSNAYYCKYSRDGSTTTGCEIIYYAGTIESKAGGDLVPESQNDGSGNYSVVAIKRQAFKKAIAKAGGGTTARVDIDLSTCTTVGDSAFEGSSGAPLRVGTLSLGMVHNIGKNAFKYNDIEYSDARPGSFTGMSALGAYAFQNAKVAGGILDLHGSNERYSADDSVLVSFEMNGAYVGNTDTGNAILDLRNIRTIHSNFANNAILKCDIRLDGVESIASNAFDGAIQGNSAHTNVVDARNVRAIGQEAFKGIECNTFYLGTRSTDLEADGYTAYISIIGSTGGEHIGTFVLDGSFVTSNVPAIASTDPTSQVVIQNLKIARVTDTGGNVVKTTIPAYAFATTRTVENAQFTMSSPNLTINDVTTGETTGTGQEQATVYASFDIADHAFRGTGFSAQEKNFEGVIDVGAEAFAASTIRSLNLGSAIATIQSESFIHYCDSIRLLTINTVLPEPDPDASTGVDQNDYSDYIVELIGTAAANEKLSSTGTKVGTDADPFQISVPQRVKELYITHDIWKGWKNYFVADVYETSVGDCVWKYYIIDSSGTADAIAKGVHIVGFDYKGTATDLTGRTAGGAVVQVPGAVTNGGITYKVTEFGENKDIFEVLTNNENFTAFMVDFGYGSTGSIAGDNLKYVNGAALQSPKLWGISWTTSAAAAYAMSGNQLLHKIGNGQDDDREIVRVFDYTCTYNTRARRWVFTEQTATNFAIGVHIVRILNGAFSGNQHITSVKVDAPTKGSTYSFAPSLRHIEAGAFAGSKVKTFDLRNCYDSIKDTQNNTYPNSTVVSIGENAFGAAREKVLNDQGYYEYEGVTDLSIIVPAGIPLASNWTLADKYKNDSAYFLYEKYGCISEATPDERSTGSSVESKKSASLAKQGTTEVTLSGITYHLMESGTEYEGTTYTSKANNPVAVIIGLSNASAAQDTLIIPATIAVKGVSYDVIGITDTAFGTNDVLESLVLPNKDVVYSSAALAGCSKLASIQYNDIMAYTESARNNVASLPTESAQAFIEDHSEDSGE